VLEDGYFASTRVVRRWNKGGVGCHERAYRREQGDLPWPDIRNGAVAALVMEVTRAQANVGPFGDVEDHIAVDGLVLAVRS